jgi:hypothetical protein
MLYARTAVVLILSYMCAVPAWGQGDACRHRTIPVSVVRNDNVSVNPLSIANFEGTYRKKQIRIASATFNHMPLRVILLIDVSGSMRDPRSESNWNLMEDVAEDLLAGLPPDSEIGLGFFSKEIEPIVRPTTDRKALLDQIEGLRARKSSLAKTALWAAILDSLKMFGSPHLGDVIYVITDGEDNQNKVTATQVAQTLNETGVRLFAFLFQKQGFDALRLPPNTSSPIDVARVSEDTGGRAIGFSTYYNGEYFAGIPAQDSARVDKSGKPTWLGSHLRSQYQQMLNFYQIDIDLPETVDKPRDWKLDLVGFDKSQMDILVLKYPRMLVPCR